MKGLYRKPGSQRAKASRGLRAALCLSLVLGLITANGAISQAIAGPIERYPSLPVGGFTSDNVEWVKNLAIPGVVQTGTKVGDYFFVTVDALGLLIFDVSDPLDPVQVGHQPLPHVTENESVATNGDLVVMTSGGSLGYGSENSGVLFVIDTSDKSDPHIVGSLPLAGQHTFECILHCTWAYGGFGAIVDLRDPTNPILMEEKWHRDLEFLPPNGGLHDVTEVKPGYVLTSTYPMYYLDANDPLNPVVLAGSDPSTGSQHNVLWPNAGKDKLVLSAHEFGITGNGTCEINEELDRQTGQEVVVRAWDASDWEKTHTFVGLGKWRPKNGNFEDGDPPVSGFGFSGCSTHYFDPHPKWHNGGLLAEAAYGHGLKFLEVSKDGQFEQVGFFLGVETGAQGAYWMDDNIVYVTDVHRGIDIVRLDSPTNGNRPQPQANLDKPEGSERGPNRLCTRATPFLCYLGGIVPWP